MCVCVATSVTESSLQFNGRDLTRENITDEEIRKEMSDFEFSKVVEMSRDRQLYQHLIDSLFPTIHGEYPV